MNRNAALTCLLVAVLFAACSSPRIKPVTVGCKNFTEQMILGEIVAQHLEQRLGEKVERRFPVGGTLVAHQAELAGEIDVYPEYTGVAYAAILRLASPGDAAIVRERVKDEYSKQFQFTWIAAPGFDNSTTIVVRQDDAAAKKLTTLSDATGDDLYWTVGTTSEFVERPDGFSNLMRSYRLRLSAAARTMDYHLLYKALEEKQVDMIAGHMTDGMLSTPAVVALRDDRRAFPPNEAGLVVRDATLQARPAMRAALEELAGKISADTMRKLNYEVDGKHRKPADVAAEFLKSGTVH